MRKIDADRFEKELRKYADVKLQNGEREKAVNVLNAISVLKQQPTIEEVTGEWIKQNTYSVYAECSVCKETVRTYSDKMNPYLPNYCPNCGSKNREVE